jgi:tRNA 2-thiouridine synthesizing protein A
MTAERDLRQGCPRQGGAGTLGDLASGQVLKLGATDPGSVKDFQAFCKQTGNELLSHSDGPEFTFFMKKR